MCYLKQLQKQVSLTAVQQNNEFSSNVIAQEHRNPGHFNQIPSNFFYQKIYYCRNSAQNYLIQSRNQLRNPHFPLFQVVSQTSTLVTVKIRRYDLSGLDQILSKWSQRQFFRKSIASLVQACLQLEVLYREFQLSESGIRADLDHNIVVWPSEDHERCFQPRLAFQSNNLSNEEAKNTRVEFHLQRIQMLLINKIYKNLLKIEFLSLYKEINQVKQILLVQNLMTNQHKREKNSLQNQQEHSPSDCPRQLPLKRLYTSNLNYFPDKNNDRLRQDEKKHCQQMKRFSAIQTGFHSRVKSNPSFFNSPRNMFCRIKDGNINNSRNKPSVKIFNQKQINRVPTFVRQRQEKRRSLALGDIIDIFSKEETHSEKRKLINRHQTLGKFKIEHLEEQTSFEYASSEEEQQTNQPTAVSNQVQCQNQKNFKSCELTRHAKSIQCTQTQTTIASLRQCLSSKNFFLSTLSPKEQKQINQDLQKIFNSRKIACFDDQYFQNQELKMQFLLLID